MQLAFDGNMNNNTYIIVALRDHWIAITFRPTTDRLHQNIDRIAGNAYPITQNDFG